MRHRGAGPYHILILWAEDEAGRDRIGRELVELGGLPIAAGPGRLFGFDTAAARDAAVLCLRHAHGLDRVAPMGIVAERPAQGR
jgi:hypothetical protein